MVAVEDPPPGGGEDLGDPLHQQVGDLLVGGAGTGRILRRERGGPAETEVHRHATGPPRAQRESLLGAPEAHREHRDPRAAGQEPGPRMGTLEPAVRAAMPLRVDEDGVPLVEQAEGLAESGSVGRAPDHREGVVPDDEEARRRGCGSSRSWP